MSAAAINDRRMRAIEAGHDAAVKYLIGEQPVRGIETAVQVATQVKITEDIIDAARRAALTTPVTSSSLHSALAAGFAAAGFEVVE